MLALTAQAASGSSPSSFSGSLHQARLAVTPAAQFKEVWPEVQHVPMQTHP